MIFALEKERDGGWHQLGVVIAKSWADTQKILEMSVPLVDQQGNIIIKPDKAISGYRLMETKEIVGPLE